MNVQSVLDEAQKLARMGSFLWCQDSEEMEFSESLRDVLGIDASEPPAMQALVDRFRAEDRRRLMDVLRNEDGSGARGALFAVEREGGSRCLQVKSKGLDGGAMVLGTVLEVAGSATREHELSNLLMVIQGNLDLIRMNLSKPEKIPIHVDLATHAVERLAALSEPARLR